MPLLHPYESKSLHICCLLHFRGENVLGGQDLHYLSYLLFLYKHFIHHLPRLSILNLQLRLYFLSME